MDETYSLMETLQQIYERHCVTGPDVGHGDKGGTHSYIPVYEKLLAPFRNCEANFMEIGLALGLSLAMWQEYFAPGTVIYGVDKGIVFDREPFDTFLIEADATKPELLPKLDQCLESPAMFDVVIDDGSHMAADQIATFNLLKPRMREGGIYIIEDILSLDMERERFLALHDRTEIIDLRNVKGRFDDVLIVYRF